MDGYQGDIEKLTLANSYFRHVLYTAMHSQLVLMSLLPEEEIGMEVHELSDQFFRFEQGEGKVIIDGHEHEVKNGDVIIVPAGNMHNIINTSKTLSLKLYTLYSPPHHPDQTIHKTKAEAVKSEK